MRRSSRRSSVDWRCVFRRATASSSRRRVPEASVRKEFYGIVPHADLTAGRTPNAVWLYESATRRGQPARYFQVYDYGDGTGVALDLERPDSDGETPCVAAHAGDWGAPEDVALNFGTFFLTIVREVLED